MAPPVEETAQVKTRGEGLWHPTAWEAQWGRRERPGLAGMLGARNPQPPSHWTASHSSVLLCLTPPTLLPPQTPA